MSVSALNIGLSGLLAIVLLQGCGKSEEMQNTGTATVPDYASSSAAASAAVSDDDRTEKPTVNLVVAKDANTSSAMSFPTDIPQLHAFFLARDTKQGEKLRGVWIAEDVGDSSPKETKIDESTIVAKSKEFSGAFSIAKPPNGWPVGKYRVEIYVSDDLAGSTKFTIK